MNELTLSIVSHGHGAMVHQLLGDLARLPSTQGARVVVTLNVPEDLGDLRRYRCLDIVVRRNATPQGFGHNHNAAFGDCQGRWYGVLNPDLRLPSDPFPSLLAALQSTSRPGLAAPVVTNSAGSVEDSVRRNLTPWSLLARWLGQRRADDPGAAPFFWVAGMFMLFDAAAYRSIAGFDERFFLYCEDYDVCARLRLAGRAIALVPTARVVHDAQRDSHRSGRHLRWHLQSLAKVWLSGAFWRVTLASRAGSRSA